MTRDSLASSPTTPFDQHHSAFTVDLGDDTSDLQPWFGLDILDRDPDAIPSTTTTTVTTPTSTNTTQNANQLDTRFLLVSLLFSTSIDSPLFSLVVQLINLFI